ncbi:MAG: choice-of-anchor Q domain-containing protein [Planctomycetaceae bacterium]
MTKPSTNSEALEDRTLLATVFAEVDTLQDLVDENDGLTSLREAIAFGENLSPGGSGTPRGQLTIGFADGLAGTIELNSLLTISSPGVVFIDGPGANLLTIDANGLASAFRIDNGDVGLVGAGISGMTITGASASGNDGAIANFEDLTLKNVWVTGNTSTGTGVGLSHENGSLRVSNSTFSNNHGLQGALSLNSGTAEIVNTTVSGNSSTGFGGGIVAIGSTTVIRNSTIVGNQADSDNSGAETGGGLFGNSGLITIHNSIIAGNFRGSSASELADDIAGTLTSASTFNFVGDSGTAGGLVHGENGNILGIDGGGIIDTNLVLDVTLADNGGPTLTHALVAGSPAIDTGNNAQALNSNGGALASDQRGSARILDGNEDGTFTVDMGAHELGLRVNTDADTVTDIEFDRLSLREAIEIANGTGERITFNPLMSGSTIVLDGEQLEITGDMTIAGLGATALTIDANGGSRVFEVDDANVTISGLAITGGDASASPDESSFDNLGGGILNENGSLTLTGVHVHGNSAEWGGGVNNWRGTLVLESSTINGNIATGNGGGLYNWGNGGAASATIANTTFSGNTGSTSGVINWPGDSSATIVANHITMVDNAGNDFVNLAGGTATLTNSLLVGTTQGTLTAASGNNLVVAGADGIVDTTLSHNGGPTQTHALLEDSSAIDGGRASSLPDQRGHDRVESPDIGAFEKAFAGVDDTATTTAGNSVSIDVLGNDVSGDNTRILGLTGAQDGELTGDFENGPVTYTPNGGFTGSDGFSYAVGLKADEQSSAGETAEEGNAVSVDGDWAIVGARRDDVVDRNAGAAFIYRRNGATWEKFQELRPAELELRDRFGYSVAIDGTTAVVGARLDGDNGFKSGSVYVFEFDASQDRFVQTQKLTNGSQRSQFGHAVALDGNTLVVGARRDREGSANSGAVHVLERTVRGFQETHFLKADDGAKGDQFGFAVAISGDSIVASAWKDNTGDAVDSGSVYVFDRNQGGTDNWGQLAKVEASDQAQFDLFGFSVDYGNDGNTIIVGKPVRSRENRAGAAYILERSVSPAETIIQSSNSAPLDNFGYSVSMSGDEVIVGARLDETGGNAAGAAYVFGRNAGGSNNWGANQTLLGNRRDSFGFAVAMDENTILVGANLRNGANGDGAEDAGAVIFEDRRTENANVSIQVNAPQYSGSGIGFGGSEITNEQLAPIVNAARDFWGQQGLTPEQLTALHSAQVNVAPLSGTLLGFESGGAVTIDSDAAGHGWYVDPTPQNLNDDTIGNRMDLLSNVTHELGHVIGLADRYDAASSDDVMHGFLGLGERQLGKALSLDAVFADTGDTKDSLFAL